MSPGNPFGQKVEGQSYSHENIAGMGLCTLVSAGFTRNPRRLYGYSI